MKSPKNVTLKFPYQCWSWLSLPEVQVQQMALEAFRFARLSCTPPRGEPFLIEGQPAWSGRDSFVDALVEGFQGQVMLAARASGLRDYDRLAQEFEGFALLLSVERDLLSVDPGPVKRRRLLREPSTTTLDEVRS